MRGVTCRLFSTPSAIIFFLAWVAMLIFCGIIASVKVMMLDSRAVGLVIERLALVTNILTDVTLPIARGKFQEAEKMMDDRKP